MQIGARAMVYMNLKLGQPYMYRHKYEVWAIIRWHIDTKSNTHAHVELELLVT